jgi:type I restriction enzyme S subunit
VDFWPHNACLYVIDFHGNDERFAYYLLKSLDFSSFNSGSAQPSLNRNFIHPISIEVPPLPEQRAIAHILGTLDDKIELNRRMNETLEAMARALFKSWFVDFDPVRAKAAGRQPYGMDAETAALFPDSFKDSPLGEVPRGWGVEKLRECCSRVENGGTPRRDEPAYWEPGTVPWLTSSEVRQSIVIETENFISEEGLANSSAKLWPSGTTVVALYGATAGQVCFLAKQMCTNQACCGLTPAESASFYLYLRTSSSVEAFAQQARGSAQQNLSQQIVADFPTLIPASEVLKSFENRVRPLFEKWIANLTESRTLAALRDALLPKLLSGEVKVE